MNTPFIQKPQVRIAVVYMVVASLWIVLSDSLLHALSIDADLIPSLSILKGLGFVLLTTIILYIHLRHEFTSRSGLEAELRRQIDHIQQSEIALAASEARLRIKDSAIAASITPIALADLEGYLTYVNDAFLKLWRLDDDTQALGRSVLEFWESRDAAQAVVNMIRQNDHFVGELTARRADGTLAEVALTASMVRDDRGQPVCMMGSFNDVTVARQAERYALENERLKARFQKEQESNILIQRVVSALSHDLRTSLTAISTSRDLLSHYHDRMTPPKRKEKLDAIGHQIRFALELLDDTVNLVRGNLNADATFRPAPVNLAALCQISIDSLRSSEDVGQRLTFANLTAPEILVVDETLVSRILLNLLSNAIKYSPPESEIRLDMRYEYETGRVLLAVRDQGMGISEQDLPHIFEPFYRARDTGQIRGTGLGLSIVKDCVIRHGGTIQVESQPGAGSVFVVALPARVHHTNSAAV